MKKVIANIRQKRRVRKALKLERRNPNPQTYKRWEHKSWGDVIYMSADWTVRGHLIRRPHVGDSLIFEMAAGRNVRGIFVEVKHLRNPSDMFFGKIQPIGYVDTK